MRSKMHRVTALVIAGAQRLPLLAAVLAIASPAWATNPEDEAAAEVLFQDAKKLVAAGDLAAACPKLAESQRLDPGSGTALHLADCYEKQNKLASAWITFREAEMMARSTSNTVREAEAARRAGLLAPRLAKLVFVVPPGARVPGLVLRRDEREVREGQWGSSLPADIGPHKIDAAAPGYKPWTTVVRIESDASTTPIEVPVLEKLPEQAPPTPAALPFPAPAAGPARWSTQRIAGAAVGGAGVVGLGLGTAFGAIALSKNAAVQANCMPNNPNVCSQTGIDLKKDALSFAHASTAALVLGGAAVAGGVVLILTATGAEPTQAAARVQAAPILGPGTAGLAVLGTW